MSFLGRLGKRLKFWNHLFQHYPNKTACGTIIHYILTLGGRIFFRELVNKVMFFPKCLKKLIPDVPISDDPIYYRWLVNNYPRSNDLKRKCENLTRLNYKVKISIILPVYNTPRHFLCEAIESVLNQIYPFWELCIVDDASTFPYVRSTLEGYEQKDDRIKVVFRQENGHISIACNSGLDIANGEYIALLDHDDVLPPHALYEVALEINRNPEVDMIYSDEDHIDSQGRHKLPHFKPDWSPDSFLAWMYTCHLGVYRRNLVNKIKGFRQGFEGSQDYDLVLRLSEKSNKIIHIPKILYHWRMWKESTAGGNYAKPYAYQSAEKALNDALLRRKEFGKVISHPEYKGFYQVRYKIRECSLVSIIIPAVPTNYDSLERCLSAVFNKASYPNYEVLLVADASQEFETCRILEKWKKKEPQRFQYYSANTSFNISQINNYAVSKSNGTYLLFLSSYTKVITDDYLIAMIEHAQRPSIGAVGSHILYSDSTTKQVGIILGAGGNVTDVYDGDYYKNLGNCPTLKTNRNYSAVSGDCLMCRRTLFDEIGQFDENLCCDYFDTDLCLKMIEKGYNNIYLPHVKLYNFEHKKNSKRLTAMEPQNRLNRDQEYFETKWKKYSDHDPFFSPHLRKAYKS